MNVVESMTRFPEEQVIVEARDELSQSRRTQGASMAEDTYRRTVGRAVLQEIRLTLASLRDSADPKTVSHALIYADSQSIAELEGRLGRDSSEILGTLAALEYVNLVGSEMDFGVRRYSLIPPSDGVQR